MSKQDSKTRRVNHTDSDHRRRLKARMAEVGFVPGTQKAYLREFDRFERSVHPATGATATVSDAHAHVARLKRSGASSTARSHASAALRFFFEDVRGLTWRPVSPLRRRMIEDKATDPVLYKALGPGVWCDTKWVVHSKPVGSGETAYRYLARYVTRVALTERAILGHTDSCIALRYRDSRRNKPRTLRLEPREFLRRFLQHILPARFRKVRHYGLHHSSKRATLKTLQAAMALVHAQPPPPPAATPPAAAPRCPRCDTPMDFDARLTLLQWLARAAQPSPAQRAPP